MFPYTSDKSKKMELLDKTNSDKNVKLPDPCLRPFSPTSPSTWENLTQINDNNREISLETIDLD